MDLRQPPLYLPPAGRLAQAPAEQSAHPGPRRGEDDDARCGVLRSPGRGAALRRWGVAWLLAAAIAISYFDRQTLSVAVAAIQRDFPITNTQFSQLQAAFLLAYALMYAGGGRLVDALGTKRGHTAIMIWRSLACANHGLASG